MRQLQAVARRFDTPIRVIDGPMTSAVIHRPGDSDKPADTFLVPHFILRTTHASLLKPGMVIFWPKVQRHFLLAEHHQSADRQTFIMFPALRKVSWTRSTKVIDPLTRLEKTTGDQPAGEMWVMWQRVRREQMDLTARVQQERYIVATGADVHLRDKLDGKVVDRRDDVYGIKLLEVMG